MRMRDMMRISDSCDTSNSSVYSSLLNLVYEVWPRTESSAAVSIHVRHGSEGCKAWLVVSDFFHVRLSIWSDHLFHSGHC